MIHFLCFNQGFTLADLKSFFVFQLSVDFYDFVVNFDGTVIFSGGLSVVNFG